MKKVGIIGATGAIGVSLINKCVENNVDVYVFVRKKSKKLGNIPINRKVHIIFCDMEEMKNFNIKDIPQLDVFYYFSWSNTFGEDARNNMKVQIANIEYAIDAVNFANRLGCKRFIGAGSQAEYGRCYAPLTPNTPCFPENGYGMAKLCAGQMTKIECHKLSIEHIWTRVLSIYGPYDGENTMISYAIKSCLKGVNPEFTKCEQIWDYLSSYDAGKAFFLIGERGIPDKIYVIGSGKTRRLSEYIDIICKYTNENIKPLFGKISYNSNQVMYLKADISELKNDTGFEPNVEFEDGIKKTIHWYKEHYYEKN